MKTPPRPGPISFSAHEGQSVSAILGAYAYNCYPVMLDLTDGVRHHLLSVTGKSLFVWEDLEPTHAYFKLGQHLKALEALKLPKLREMELEDIPEELQAPLKRMRILRPGDGLREQLDSVIPFMPDDQKVSCARDLISSWQAAQQASQEVLAPPPMEEMAEGMGGYAGRRMLLIPRHGCLLVTQYSPAT